MKKPFPCIPCLQSWENRDKIQQLSFFGKEITMEKCKYCNTWLEDGVTVCPQCGKDQLEAPKSRLSTGKTVLAIATLVAAAILMAAVILNGNSPIVPGDNVVAMSSDETEPVEETQPTIPADGNPDDVTCKGTYTADDEAAVAARDTVVATAGDLELTVSQLQAFYWMEVRNFLTQYGAYAAYFGLDYQQPLDTQICPVMETPMTWQQYFVDAALNTWANYATMAAEADAQGYEMGEAMKASLEGAPASLETSSVEYGFSSAADLIHNTLGSAAEMEDYLNFMSLYYKANGYYNSLVAQIQPTDEELDAFFQEHIDGYAESGITKDTVSVDVRHILIYPEGADGTNIFTDEFTDEAWAAGEAAAQAILDQWLAGDKTEESFAALANENSQDPGSNKNGGLYTGVTEGEMVAAFNDWCFDKERQVGDTGIVKTEYGYHVMFFSGSTPMWMDYAKSDFVNERASAQAAEIGAKFPLTVHYENILLGNTSLD